ncbi:hypothetical protein CapIbe_010369 [Capra ibex]
MFKDFLLFPLTTLRSNIDADSWGDTQPEFWLQGKSSWAPNRLPSTQTRKTIYRRLSAAVFQLNLSCVCAFNSSILYAV